MGGALHKMKSWKAEGSQSPAKSDKSLSPNGKLPVSPSRSYPPNGTHFTYEKAKLKALSQNKAGKRKDSTASAVGQKRRNLKRKLEDIESTDMRPKRRRVNSSDRKLLKQLDGASNKTDVLDAREIIVARRAGRLENEKMSFRKDILENKEEENVEKQRSKEKLKLNNMQRVRSSHDDYDGMNKLDKSTIKIVDQNLNHITESINRENLKEIYSKKIQDASDSSPFKGQMSAFEISLLKGKQNLERRKSIESATLRSSPRMNANVPKPDYREKKRNKSRLSLASSLDRQELLDKKTKRNIKKTRKRTRTVDVVGSLSPSSVENKIVKPVPKRRKSKVSIKAAVSLNTEKTIKFRLNGSPKLKTLPTRLSLDSLSGTSDQHQGSAFTSLHKQIMPNKVSGTPTALNSPAIISSDSKSSTCFNKPLERPNTLPVNKCDSPRKCENLSDHCYTKATETAKTKNEQMSKSRSKKSLEETVNMLRRNTSAKCKEITHGKLSLTPSRSESRTSRRSSVKHS
ncbi:uncharacterized protein LOC128548687 [Mercenaria mercenaria]|uniref:uncharacterized protein LOC128548687 n=1 Tax=Mercenaria mercenaria TaxID=6596 RepID=UPI00234EE04E|nr:uncharacterized protein LOC128548687 [Mercenaria mercenaria]